MALLTKWKPEEEGVRDAQPSRPCRREEGRRGERRKGEWGLFNTHTHTHTHTKETNQGLQPGGVVDLSAQDQARRISSNNLRADTIKTVWL